MQQSDPRHESLEPGPAAASPSQPLSRRPQVEVGALTVLEDRKLMSGDENGCRTAACPLQGLWLCSSVPVPAIGASPKDAAPQTA